MAVVMSTLHLRKNLIVFYCNKIILADSITHADKLYSQKANVCKYFQAILTYMFYQLCTEKLLAQDPDYWRLSV